MACTLPLVRRLVCLAVPFCLASATPALAQESRAFAGAVFGVSTLSADGRSVTSPSEARVSLYKPENGPAVNAFVGWHLGRFFSVQGNYVWNPNDLTLLSSIVSNDGGGFYEQMRTSSQHAAVADALLYFRRLGSGIRPYLSTGVGVMRFAGHPAGLPVASGLMPPAGAIRSTRLALRVAVGIDLAMRDGWSFRYSFSETISGNPVSPQLMPPGQRNLANFQNLFGIVRRL